MGRKLFGDAAEHHQFYRNSFKQLSDIQQRQVGMMLGAMVADAACRQYELAASGAGTLLSSSMSLLSSSPCDDVLRREEGVGSLGDAELAFPALDMTTTGNGNHIGAIVDPLRFQSLTGEFLSQLLHVMSAARGAFEVELVAPRWTAVAQAHVEAFAELHGRLIHVAPILLPLACVYPYCDDEALWDFSQPFAELLTATPSSDAATSLESDDVEKGCEAAITVGKEGAFDAHVVANTLSLQSLGMRYLQSNPDPLKNTSLVCRAASSSTNAQQGGRALLRDSLLFSPQPSSSLSADSWLVSDAAALCTAVHTIQGARSYAHGIRRVIRTLGMPAASTSTTALTTTRGGLRLCAPAMVAGALLGAKFGVQGIPLEWISATRDHQSLCTVAIEVCQWAWNPSR